MWKGPDNNIIAKTLVTKHFISGKSNTGRARTILRPLRTSLNLETKSETKISLKTFVNSNLFWDQKQSQTWDQNLWLETIFGLSMFCEYGPSIYLALHRYFSLSCEARWQGNFCTGDYSVLPIVIRVFYMKDFHFWPVFTQLYVYLPAYLMQQCHEITLVLLTW